jgi:D-sedoheptulose 7-phosphate isomerase
MELKPDYFLDYAGEVLAGLRETIATLGNGEQVSVSQAIDNFAREVHGLKGVTSHENKIFFVGNGASATMAEHMSADFFKNAEINTVTSSETSYLTAVGNDIGFDSVFAHRISRIGESGDILVAISSSGNSENIFQAIMAAKEKNIFVVTVTGMKEDNRARKAGDLNFFVPLKTYGLVEAAHPLLLHCMLDRYLDTYKGGRI